MSAFSSLYSLSNLKLAWKRIRTGQNVAYKQYFREIYDAYSFALEENLKDLSESIRLSTYSPTKPQRLMIPKSSGLQRPITLLSVEDQIVLQAIANIFAYKLRDKKLQSDETVACSNRLNTKSPKSIYFLERWQDSYELFKQRVYQHFNNGYNYTADFDLTSFYDTISHDLLIMAFSPRGGNQIFCNFVLKCLRSWTPKQYTHGIPQGPIASDFIAECIMLSIDKEMNSSFKYTRYVDDIRILGHNEFEIYTGINKLDRLTRELGLIPHSGKLGIRLSKDKYEALGKMPSLKTTGNNKPRQRQSMKNVFYSSLTKKKDSVEDPSRFKFSIYRLPADEEILKHILRLVPRHPELVDMFMYYIEKFGVRRKVANALLKLINAGTPYDYIEGSYWSTLASAAPKSLISTQYSNALNKLSVTTVGQIALRNGLYRVLNESKEINVLRDYYKYLINEPSYVIQAYTLSRITSIFPSAIAFNNLIKKSVESPFVDPGVVAAWNIGLYGVDWSSLLIDTTKLSGPVKNTLHKLGYLKKKGSVRTQSLGTLVSRRFQVQIWTLWKKLLKADYKHCHMLLVLAENAFDDSPSTWMACMDSFNDLVIRNVLIHLNNRYPGTRVPLTSNNNGLIDFGVLLDPTGYLSRSIPTSHGIFRDFHMRRNSLPTSHAKDKRTMQNSKALKHSDRPYHVNSLRDGYTELFAYILQHGF